MAEMMGSSLPVMISGISCPGAMAWYSIFWCSSYLCRHSSQVRFSSSINYKPFSIRFLKSKVFTIGISLHPLVIRPKAILSVDLELSNAKSLIYSLFCLKSSIPVQNRSFVIFVVADSEGISPVSLSLGFGTAACVKLLTVKSDICA